MRKDSVLFAIVASLILMLPSCSRDRSEPPNDGAVETPVPANNAVEAPAHGDANVTPGSYEDWCGEHQVPETLCTRCNPSLVAAFKATGDWCDEHGLPESQCRQCNPTLEIVRPPKPEVK